MTFDSVNNPLLLILNYLPVCHWIRSTIIGMQNGINEILVSTKSYFCFHNISIRREKRAHQAQCFICTSSHLRSQQG